MGAKSGSRTPVSGLSTSSTARLWSPDRFRCSGHMADGSQGYTFDIVHCAQQMYTGTASSDSQAMLDRLASGHNGFFHWRNFGKMIPPCKTVR